jgi:hypothetical protein
MTDIACSHLPFIKAQEQDFAKQPCPSNLDSHLFLSCSVIFILSRMGISLMLACQGLTLSLFEPFVSYEGNEML